MLIGLLAKLLPGLLILWPAFGLRRAAAGGVLLSANLSLVLAAITIAEDLGRFEEATSAALLVLALVTTAAAPLGFNALLPRRGLAARARAIVVGASDTGRYVALRLHREGMTVVAVDRDAAALAPLAQAGCHTVVGDARDAGIIARARPEISEVAVIAVALTEDSFEIAQALRAAARGLRIVTWRAEADHRLAELDVDVYLRSRATAVALAGAVLRPGLYQALGSEDFGGLEEVTLRNVRATGIALRDLGLPGGCAGDPDLARGGDRDPRGRHAAAVGRPRHAGRRAGGRRGRVRDAQWPSPGADGRRGDPAAPGDAGPAGAGGARLAGRGEAAGQAAARAACAGPDPARLRRVPGSRRPMSAQPEAGERGVRLPPAPAARLVEVKRKLDGEEQRFDLERWLVRPDLVVGRWLAGPDNPFGLPAASYSWGVWRPRLPIGVYRLHAPDGTLLRYRLDVIEDVEVGDGEVRYRDLLLDASFLPGPAPGDYALRFEDEDEVAAAVADRAAEPGAALAHRSGCGACWRSGRRRCGVGSIGGSRRRSRG